MINEIIIGLCTLLFTAIGALVMHYIGSVTTRLKEHDALVNDLRIKVTELEVKLKAFETSFDAIEHNNDSCLMKLLVANHKELRKLEKELGIKPEVEVGSDIIAN